jgi:hypothetical protein
LDLARPATHLRHPPSCRPTEDHARRQAIEVVSVSPTLGSGRSPNERKHARSLHQWDCPHLAGGKYPNRVRYTNSSAARTSLPSGLRNSSRIVK